MKLTPSSTTRRSVAMAWSRLGGSPQMPRPVIRIAPNPRRLTVRSPPTSMVPAAAAVGCALTAYLLILDMITLNASLSCSGADLRPGQGQLDRLGQRFDVIGTVVTHAVDEERGGSRYAGKVGRIGVLGHPRRAHVFTQVRGEPLGVQAK